MEDKKGTRSRSACRLAVQGNPGRVRWLIGDERYWRYTLKVLVGVPIILMCALLIAIALPHAATAKRAPRSSTQLSKFETSQMVSEELKNPVALAQGYHYSEALDRETRNELLNDIRTTYNPPEQVPFKVNVNRMKSRKNRRRKRRKAYRGGKRVRQFWATPFETRSRRKVTIANPEKTTPFLEHESLWKQRLSEPEVRQIQATTMMRYMDFTVNPCDNFYDFACGNWDKYNFIPPDRTEYDTFELLREGLDVAMRDLLEDHDHILEGLTYEDARVKAKHLYKSCMNEELLAQRGAEPLLELLVNLGRWPIIDKMWDESQFDFIWLVAQLKLFNNDILIAEWVGPDIQNSDEYIIQIDQTNLGLPSREYYLDDANWKYLDSYRIFMVTVAHLLGADLDIATRDANDIIEFETELAKLVALQSDRRNISDIYVRTDIDGLFYMVPQIDWHRYFRIVLQRNIDPAEPVACFCMEYLQKFVALISVTPQRTIANYLLWRFVRHRVNNLDPRFQQAKQRFYYILFGREKPPPRWQECVSQVNSNLGMAVGSLFVQRYFDESSKNDTLQMTIQLQRAFQEVLETLGWLDENTKKLAKTKIDAMRLKIGYPDFILNPEELSARYVDIHTHPDFYFENMLSILKHLTRVEHARLGTAVNKTLWNTAPAVVNAYYSRNKNQIMFPAGILQPPFYHKHFPPSLNYGGIGVVIGHEITHGFDDKGRLFDKDGNLQKWWHEDSVNNFRERAQCLIDQYDSYVLPVVNENVNGENTQGENIADNGGIKHAFRAYQEWLRDHGNHDETLPGLNLTKEQLFFLNFAQIWCGVSRPEAARNKLRTALHSPGRFRVIGSLSNSVDFAEVFHCPAGSPMNPKTKCSIW